MNVQRTGLGVAVALHAVVIAALLSYAPARKALLDAAPVMVRLITPPRIEEPKPAPAAELPKPKPVHPHHPKPVTPPPAPVLAAPVEAPSPAVAPPVAAAPPPPVQAAPAPAPLPVTPPDFSAAYLNNPAPVYPAMAKRLHEQGKVVLRVHVTAAGGVDEIQLRSSSGHSRLDDAAREAVQRWKFVPAKHGSESVAAWVLVPIPFVLIGS